MNERLRHQLAIISDCGHPMPPGTTILDFGCGNGDGVRAMREAGYDAWGCDVKFKPGANQDLHDQSILRQISMEPYDVPFEDQRFDVVITNEVFEHVQNYDSTIREIHRLLKPGGISLNLFPARWMPVEPHVYVPLATVFRPKWWLYLWALLGIRNPFQQGLPASEVAKRNYEYLRSSTNYLPASEIRSHFGAHFDDVRFVEDIFLRNATSPKARALNRLVQAVPFMKNVYSTCWNRVLVAVRKEA